MLQGDGHVAKIEEERERKLRRSRMRWKYNSKVDLV
jgi:hypothetical protein